MIVPSTYTAQQLQEAITRPIFLVELGFTIPVYLSTRGPTTISGGNTYEAAQMEVAGIQSGDGGELRATVRLSPAYIDQVVTNSIVDTPIKIDGLWGEEPFFGVDAIRLFDGVVSDAPVSRDWIDLACVQSNSQGEQVPAVYYAHQNLQPAGTKIAIKGFTIIIGKSE